MSTVSTPASVTIVGAGQAGGWVASTLRAEGFVGAITLIGDETHPPYERPPLSKEALAGTRTIEQAYIKPLAFYREAEIDLRRGLLVTGIDRADRRIAFADGAYADYDMLVIATGARARRLPAAEVSSDRIHYLRNHADMQQLQPRLRPGRALMIVGGGFIGMEIAAVAVRAGMEVTVLEQAPSLMGRVLPSVVSDHLAARHRAEGVRIILDAHAERFVANGDSISVHLADGRILCADDVVIGIGAEPNVELAADAGLDVQDGVVTDSLGRTSDPLIRAAGDVTRHFNPLLGRYVRLESWLNAQNQAIAVARGIMGNAAPYAETPWLWSDQYDVNLQMAGMPGPADKIIVRGDPDSGRFCAFTVAGRTLTGAFTINQARDMRPSRQLIGSNDEVDLALLADPAVSLATLVRQAK